MNKKTWALIAVVAVLVLVAAVVAKKSLTPGGDTQSNVADFAKSINHTNDNTPSVPPEELAKGRTGPARRG